MKGLVLLCLIFILSVNIVCAIGTYLGPTSSQYTGNITNGSTLTGYVAANHICDVEYNGAHMCTSEEMLLTIRSNDTSGYSGTGWISNGPNSYLAEANDCVGWSKAPTSNTYGTFWDWETSNGTGWLVGCNAVHNISCCKGNESTVINTNTTLVTQGVGMVMIPGVVTYPTVSAPWLKIRDNDWLSLLLIILLSILINEVIEPIADRKRKPKEVRT